MYSLGKRTLLPAIRSLCIERCSGDLVIPSSRDTFTIRSLRPETVGSAPELLCQDPTACLLGLDKLATLSPLGDPIFIKDGG
jgi:hypothetical protein